MMYKICVVVTARPSYSRVKTVLEAIRAHPYLTLQLVVCGPALLRRYGTVASTIAADGFPIAARLHTAVEGGDPEIMAHTTALTMTHLASTFAQLQPDAVLTIADRFETLATATAAAYMGIPLIHLQGGEVSGSIDDKVRNAVTQLADLHLVATDRARERVEYMIDQDEWKNVRVTGCPSIDLCLRAPITPPGVLMDGVGHALNTAAPFVLVMQHPVTDSYLSAYDQTVSTWRGVMATGLPALWLWPNVDAGSDRVSKAIRMLRAAHPNAPVHVSRGLRPEDFITVAKSASVVVGNSSFGIREASFLGLPAINIGARQRGRERAANVVDIGYGPTTLTREILRLKDLRFPPSHLYGDGTSGDLCAEIISDWLQHRTASETPTLVEEYP